jgi:hypothetical protein
MFAKNFYGGNGIVGAQVNYKLFSANNLKTIIKSK